MGSKSQATKEIKAKRIQQIIDMLSSGKYKWEIVNELTNEWNCSERNVGKYLSAAYTLLSVHYDKNVLETILSKYDLLYKRAIGRGDDKLATRILDSISKVKGLYITKTDITSNGETISPTIINIIKPNDGV